MKRKHKLININMKSESQRDTMSEETVTQPQTKEENSTSMMKEQTGSTKKNRKQRRRGEDIAGEPHSSSSNNIDNQQTNTTTQSNNNSSSGGDMRSEATESTANSRASSPCSEDSYSSHDSSSKSPYTREVSAASLLPSYLSQMVQHSHEDFFVSPYFYPEFVAQLMCEGEEQKYYPLFTMLFQKLNFFGFNFIVFPHCNLQRYNINTIIMIIILSCRFLANRSIAVPIAKIA